MARSLVSRPVAAALTDGVIRPGLTVFDYGCGRGDDLRHLRKLGFGADGWDPVHSPDINRRPADVVNLGYVINVIEHAQERAEVVRSAWTLARRTLIVAARLKWEANGLAGRRAGDGWVTSKGTFQRFYAQDELRTWLEATVGVPAVAAAPGIFYLFRARAEAERLLAERARGDAAPAGLRIADLLYAQHREPLDRLRAFVSEHRRLPAALELSDTTQLAETFGTVRAAFLVLRRVTGPEQWNDVDLGSTRPSAERRFLDHQDVLQPLLDFLEARGRLPHAGELSNETEVNAALGSVRRAFSLVRRATGEARWEELATSRREDFLVYLALSAFGGRPRFGDLPDDLQHDTRDFFGSYRTACEQADRLLFAAGDAQARETACKEVRVGKLTPEALYVHAAEVGNLPPILRVYEGCGKALSGTVVDANILKLHRLKPQVSYLAYPTFDHDPHPPLSTVVVSRLARLDVTYRDFRDSDNPPILHRKDTFVGPTYPGRDKFARLTAQEERYGLLEDPARIGTRTGWDQRLSAAGVSLRGHRVVRTRAAGTSQ